MHRILIFNDSETFTSLVRDFLTSQGYEVRCARLADDGARVLKDQSVDLIIVDEFMPDMPGLEICRLLRALPALSTIPIIMTTENDIPSENKFANFDPGRDSYLHRPFEPGELLEKIRGVLRRKVQNPSFPFLPIAPAAPLPPLILEKESPPPLPKVPMTVLLKKLLTAPRDFPRDPVYPNIIPAYLMLMNALLMIGIVIAPLASMRPLFVVLLSLLSWGIIVTTLVVTSSFAGVTMSWLEGGQLVCLAAVPLLVKWAGADMVAGLTSLSPFYYTASPRLFLPSLPAWVGRIDLFEIWSAFLLAILLSKRPGVSPQKARMVAAVVWLVSAGLLLGIGHFGGLK